MKKPQPAYRLREIASLSALSHGMHLLVTKHDKKYAEGTLQGYPWSSADTAQRTSPPPVSGGGVARPVNDSIRLELFRSGGTKDIQVDDSVKIFRVVTV